MIAATCRKHLAPVAACIALCAAVLMTGCVPFPMGKYYKPHMATGTAQHYSGTACHGQAGPPAVLHVSLPAGVEARINALSGDIPEPVLGARTGTYRPLHIVLNIPRRTSVQFAGTAARLSEDGGRSWRYIHMHARVTADVSVSGPVVMATLAPTSPAAILFGRIEARAMMDYSLPHYVPQSFTLLIPSIRVAGGPILPETRLRAHAELRPESYKGQFRDHHHLIYTTPESRARVKREIADCQAEVKAGKTGLHCDYILIANLGEFKKTLGPFSLSGRWNVFDVEAGSPFRGFLRLAYTRPLDWEFARKSLQLRDGQGKTRSVPIRGLRLFLRYEIQADTTVHGSNDDRASKTMLALTVNLGRREARSYRIQLPKLRINGTLYTLQPIDLQKHVFELGIWPFNC